ncbi:MAG: hypothetical protein IT550_04960 [Novosphingobium sp.]|jgi:hypothetical protein|nr:hypothetical protein [Novosphingobium sp.]
MTGELGLLGLLVAFGLGGGVVLARNTRGLRALAAWALWLPVPFIILTFVLAGQADPTLSADRASYNFAFGFVLVSILIAIPWFGASLVGALIGWAMRRRAHGAATGDAPDTPL